MTGIASQLAKRMVLMETCKAVSQGSWLLVQSHLLASLIALSRDMAIASFFSCLVPSFLFSRSGVSMKCP